MVLFFGNNMTKCSKDLYKNYLIASSIKYSGLGLSEVFSKELSLFMSDSDESITTKPYLSINTCLVPSLEG